RTAFRRSTCSVPDSFTRRCRRRIGPAHVPLDNGSTIEHAREQRAGTSRGSDASLRLAELLAAVSLATDLAHDVPAESAMRDALLSVELARLAGWSEPDLSDVFYLALLYHIGCTGAVAAQSRLGAGYDIDVRHWMSEADYADPRELMRIAPPKFAQNGGPTPGAPAMAAFASAGRDLPE